MLKTLTGRCRDSTEFSAKSSSWFEFHQELSSKLKDCPDGLEASKSSFDRTSMQKYGKLRNIKEDSGSLKVKDGN